jgi:hypothetical protein
MTRKVVYPIVNIYNVYYRGPHPSPSSAMGFLGVYKAIYDYHPQAANELEITEGELLYILEKGTDDDWWKAKKRASDDDDDEPVGLIPNNYVGEVRRLTHIL